MTKKEKNLLIVMCLLLSLTVTFSAEEKVIELGGEQGWNAFSMKNNIQMCSGRFGYESIRIASASAQLNDTTDMLLSFENGTFADSSGNYNVVTSLLSVNNSAIMGDYSALSRGMSGGLKMRGNKDALFGKSGIIGSFSISFWLNPSIAENGETVFSWRSSRDVNYEPMYQMIAGAFFNNKFEWTFTNVFSTPFTNETSFVLESSNIVVPDSWSHHVINFNEQTGLIEYYINGRLESLVYATSNRKESGEVYQAVLGVPADLEICPLFTGLIDDFCIRKKSVEPNRHHPMVFQEGGSFYTQILGPFNTASKIIHVESVHTLPDQTDIQLFMRGGENQFGWSDTFPEWVSIQNGKPLKVVEGAYFQLAARLYTDGGGNVSPQLTSVRIVYDETDPPLPPFNVFVTAGDSSATIRWLPSVDSNVDGYFLYYGTSSGEYLGQCAVEGSSPITIDKKIEYILTGLKNGKIYYFAVSSYINTGIQNYVEGILSNEIWIRPKRNMP
ncbi:MAG TPA: LamG-like jellyroll fold domain-containing protein [Treponemataceae bacterium]|nr:LamG-like jellyroll fold domain-containing protein [Treponemataceae bacterium]